MNGLTALLAVGAALFAASGLAYARLAGAGGGRTLFVTGFAAATLAASLGIYSLSGRWSDWDTGQAYEDAGRMLAAGIAQAQRAADNAPASLVAQQALAQAYMQAGQYRQAVRIYDICLELGGDRTGTLAEKAYAMYYRDGRTISRETRAVIDEVLGINALDVRTRMLLGQDAYLNGRWDEAIGHWQELLDKGAAPGQERALKNAIAKAGRQARKKD